MARTFGSYSITLPLGTTWEEQLVLMDASGDPMDLTGFEPRMQIRDEDGVVVLDLTPQEVFVDAPATEGTVRIAVTPSRVNLLSPDNEQRVLTYDLDLRLPGVSPADPYVIPAVRGRVVVQPRVTVFP